MQKETQQSRITKSKLSNLNPIMEPSAETKLLDKLMKAVHAKNLDKVRLLLDSGTKGEGNGSQFANCPCVKKSGDSLLHLAARTSGASDILRYLIESENGNIELANFDGKTPLHDAAHFSQLASVKLLLEYGANVNALKRADWTPLMLACTKQDSLEIIQLLLQSHADILFTNKDGWNCFHIACREGNIEIIKYLIDFAEAAQVDVHYQLLFSASNNGRYPLHTAAMHGHFEICKILLEQAKKTNMKSIINDVDKCGSTALMEACRFGYTNMIDLFVDVENGANKHATNTNGMNCLHIACEAGQCLVIKHLVFRYNFDVNFPNSLNGLTALHYAVRENQVDAINTLLELGADQDISDKKGWTCLEMAKQLKKMASIETLMKFNNIDLRS